MVICAYFLLIMAQKAYSGLNLFQFDYWKQLDTPLFMSEICQIDFSFHSLLDPHWKTSLLDVFFSFGRTAFHVIISFKSHLLQEVMEDSIWGK